MPPVAWILAVGARRGRAPSHTCLASVSLNILTSSDSGLSFCLSFQLHSWL